MYTIKACGHEFYLSTQGLRQEDCECMTSLITWWIPVSKYPKPKTVGEVEEENPQKTAMAFIFYIKQFKKLKLTQQF